jgi:hypothetical protein
MIPSSSGSMLQGAAELELELEAEPEGARPNGGVTNGSDRRARGRTDSFFSPSMQHPWTAYLLGSIINPS